MGVVGEVHAPAAQQHQRGEEQGPEGQEGRSGGLRSEFREGVREARGSCQWDRKVRAVELGHNKMSWEYWSCIGNSKRGIRAWGSEQYEHLNSSKGSVSRCKRAARNKTYECQPELWLRGLERMSSDESS